MLLVAVNAWSQDVDLSITISTLAEAAATGRGVPEAGTEVVLNGTVLERAVTNSEKTEFSAELLMASGEWTESDDVMISKCIILLEGPEYSEMVPARRSRRANPAEITLNSELLVYGTFLGFAETGDGLIAVISAGGVRKL